MVKGNNYKYDGKRLSEIFDYAFCVDGFDENSVEAGVLAECFKCPNEYSDYISGMKKAIEYAKKKSALLVVCGSLYFASAVRRFCL